MRHMLAFRFSVIYFVLYAFVTHLAGGVFLLPTFALPALGTAWPLEPITLWTARSVFGITTPLVYSGNSGDTLFHWIQTGWVVLLAIAATAIWSRLDRARQEDPEDSNRRAERGKANNAPPSQEFSSTGGRTLGWARLFIRFVVAAQMFYYGMAKIIPSQFPPPSLVTLLEPIGTLSLSDLLWASIGASTSYQIFTGCAETLAGLLLLAPRTTMLGSLVGLVDMVQVFVLNMTYDFGLKQISFHLLLMCLFLLAPDLPRLANVFLFDRPARPASETPLFATRRAERAALAAQIVFGLYLLGMFSFIGWRLWADPGGTGSPRSPLYGIWNVEQLSIDGEVRPALLNEYDQRWRRVIFDTPDVVVFQRTDDSFARYGVTVEPGDGAIALTKGNSRTWRSRFTVLRPARDRLILEGEMDDRRIRIELHLLELDTFRLLGSRFRWVRPPDPYAG
jgi:hypothetical protein